MKKIAYRGFWRYFDPDTLPLTRLMNEVARLETTTHVDEADYVLYSVFSEDHWFVPDSCIKIFYTGENLVPDFNACDYAIGFDWLDFGDRYLRFPLYYLYADINELMEQKHCCDPDDVKQQKKDFCSITVSNADRHPIFSELFEALSAYRKVDSGGKWRNNVGGRTADKHAFDLSHKFSIVTENSAHPGYTTEKLVQAFAAHCIPIYWGDPTVGRVFNKKAFVCVQDYASVADVVERVRQIDASDELYYDMLRQPALADDSYAKDCQTEKLKAFLKNIFSQPAEQACRRNRFYYGQRYIQQRRQQVKSASTIFHKSYWKEAAYNMYTRLHPKETRK